jgi:hypothetical protein
MSNIIFFNTGWMDFYQGIQNDNITGGGKHVQTTGWGYEILNFKKYRNKNYGYVRVSGQIKLHKLGVNKEDDKIDGVTVVWTATEPINDGTYIIGWYNNATGYKEEQEPSESSNRFYGDDLVNYRTVAKADECTLLPRDERVVRIPRGKGGMGQSNIWYADNNSSFVRSILKYINNGVLPSFSKSEKKLKSINPRQTDPFKRQKVEKAAVKEVIKHYKKLGYEITSVELENVGWDLTAQREKTTLKLEVKGLSGKEVVVELTPNEYANLKMDFDNYRLSIVTNAISEPILRIFNYSHESGEWISGDGIQLSFEEKVSARIVGI